MSHCFINILLQVDFEKLEMEDRASRRRKEEEQKKREQLAEKKLKHLRCEMNGTFSVVSVTKCFQGILFHFPP